MCRKTFPFQHQVCPVLLYSHVTTGLERLGYSERIIWLCETECQRNKRNAAFPRQQLHWWQWLWHWYINTWLVGLTIGCNQLSCLFHLRPRSLLVKQSGFGSECIELWGLLLSVPLVPLSLPQSVSFSLFLPLTNLRWSFRDLRSCPCWLQLQLNVWGIPRLERSSLGFKSSSSAMNSVISSVFYDWKAELMCAPKGNCYLTVFLC